MAVVNWDEAEVRKTVSIPYPAGMALWPPCHGIRNRGALSRLNPLSSGDGFVAKSLS